MEKHVCSWTARLAFQGICCIPMLVAGQATEGRDSLRCPDSFKVNVFTTNRATLGKLG